MITIGEFHSGTTYNIMSARPPARHRPISEQGGPGPHGRYISSMVEGVCKAYGAKGILSYQYGYPTLINDPDMVELAGPPPYPAWAKPAY